MKILIGAACVSIIALAIYVIGGDYMVAKKSEQRTFLAECKRIAQEGRDVDASAMTANERAAALALAERCVAYIRGKN